MILQGKLASWYKEFPGIPNKDELTKPWVSQDVDPDLVMATQRILALSVLLGLDHSSSDISLADTSQLSLGLTVEGIPAIPFEEAIKFLKSRVALTKKEWNDLEEKLRFRAFTVAGLATPDSINRCRETLLNTLESGGSLVDFWNIETLQGMAGITDRSPWYWETVFRTNIQTSYNAGRAMEFRRNQPEYIEFIGIEDERQTDICATRSGLILPATDPFWNSNWPPLHFNCRSTVRGVYQAEVDVMKEEDPEWPPRPGSVPESDAGTGFGGNPLDNGNYWMMTPSQVQRGAEYGVITMLNKGDNVIADYDSQWKGWTRYDGKDGGWVDVTPQPPSDMSDTLPEFQRLANNGYRCKILPDVKNIGKYKNPEGYVDAILTDLKTPKSLKKDAIQALLKTAGSQGVRQVALKLPEVMDEASTAEVVRALKGYFSPNAGTSKIDSVIILRGDSIVKWSRDQINGKGFWL